MSDRLSISQRVTLSYMHIGYIIDEDLVLESFRTPFAEWRGGDVRLAIVLSKSHFELFEEAVARVEPG